MKSFALIFWIVAIVCLLCVFLLIPIHRPPITRIEITPSSASLAPGMSVSLSVKAYTKGEKLASEKQIQELDLIWSYKAENNAFTVSDDGVLTTISTGSGNVWVETADGKLGAPPIEVLVN